MNGTHLSRLIVSLVFIGWAAVSLLPLSDTPYDQYLVERVTARLDADGNEILSRTENVAAFEDLLNRAEDRVNATQADADTANSTLFVELIKIANEDGIDFADYFSDLRISDIGNLAKRNNLVLTRLLKDSRARLQPGLDLAGGVSVTLEIPKESLQSSGFLRQQELDEARKVILNRVDAFGVAEPVVRVKGENQIEVQIAGLDTEQNTAIIEDLIRPAKLEFSLVHRTRRPGDGQPPPLGYVSRILEREDRETGRTAEIPLYVQRIPVMTGEDISKASARITQTGGFEIVMEFTHDGGTRFAEVTRQIARENTDNNIGQLAIILDKKIVSNPQVREQISGGSARITGNFSQREALSIATALNNPLSVDLKQVALNNVSGTLASEAKEASILAAAIGAGLVIAFMVLWYGIAGVGAVITVAINVFLVIGSLAAFGATITLPGVAALVLTIGMAVDSNILIFERIREELKTGKNIRHAVTDGYAKVFSTIVDANVTTLITALILFYFGTGPVKGFGLTLAIGIFATVLTALVSSRVLMDGFAASGLMKTIPNRIRSLGERETPFLNYAKGAFFTSWSLVLIGVVSFAFHFDKAFGIDFTGGDELQVSYEQAVDDTAILDVLAAAGQDSANILHLSPLGAATEMMTIQVQTNTAEASFEALAEAFPEAAFKLEGISKVGPSVGAEVTGSAIKSIGIALFAMLFYIALRFEFGFGIGALTATVHDVLMTVSVYFFLGEIFGIGSGQFTAPMIAAVLMTVGYSINDTIVVFDRVREELTLNPGLNLRNVVHLSINRTLSRTLLTSLTTLFASFALYLFGAGVIVDFSLVFLIGVITGTFSSIFIASPIFYWYHKGDRKSVEKGEILPSYDWSSESGAGQTKKA